MKKLQKSCRKLRWIARTAGLLALLLPLCGCDIFREALEGDFERSDDPNSEEYRARYVVGVFSIVQYPRAAELEKPVIDLNGKEIYINTNSNFSSKHLKAAKVKLRPGNPEICDLEFKLDRFGKVQWQTLSGINRDSPVALVVDGRLVAKFIPEYRETDGDWVSLRVGVDPLLAKGIVKYAPKNYAFYNPDSSNWFKNL